MVGSDCKGRVVFTDPTTGRRYALRKHSSGAKKGKTYKQTCKTGTGKAKSGDKKPVAKAAPKKAKSKSCEGRKIYTDPKTGKRYVLRVRKSGASAGKRYRQSCDKATAPKAVPQTQAPNPDMTQPECPDGTRYWKYDAQCHETVANMRARGVSEAVIKANKAARAKLLKSVSKTKKSAEKAVGNCLGKTVLTGKRGALYYLNKNNNKVYCDKKQPYTASDATVDLEAEVKMAEEARQKGDKPKEAEAAAKIVKKVAKKAKEVAEKKNSIAKSALDAVKVASVELAEAEHVMRERVRQATAYAIKAANDELARRELEKAKVSVEVAKKVVEQKRAKKAKVDEMADFIVDDAEDATVTAADASAIATQIAELEKKRAAIPAGGNAIAEKLAITAQIIALRYNVVGSDEAALSAAASNPLPARPPARSPAAAPPGVPARRKVVVQAQPWYAVFNVGYNFADSDIKQDFAVGPFASEKAAAEYFDADIWYNNMNEGDATRQVEKVVKPPAGGQSVAYVVGYGPVDQLQPASMQIFKPEQFNVAAPPSRAARIPGGATAADIGL
jgi:hypothetical protein